MTILILVEPGAPNADHSDRPRGDHYGDDDGRPLTPHRHHNREHWGGDDADGPVAHPALRTHVKPRSSVPASA